MRRIYTLFLLLAMPAALFADTDKKPSAPETEPVRTYGNAQVSRIVDLDDNFCFTCNIEDWPAVIGDGVTVRIDGVAVPKIVSDTGLPNKYYSKQLKDFLAAAFASSDKKDIQLKRIKRADTFALIATVYIDGKNLADMLVEQGLAQRAEVHKINSVPPVSVPPAASASEAVRSSSAAGQEKLYYVASKTGKVYHKSTCHFVDRIKDETRVIFETKEAAEASGRRPCKSCSP